jgi:RNA recognition motif-containing protein
LRVIEGLPQQITHSIRTIYLKASFLLPIEILADHSPRSGMKLFIGNLPDDITESELSGLFGTFGEVLAVNMILDQYTGRPKGFAFVEMANRSGGQQAMENLNNRLYKSYKLACSEAKPPAKKGQRRR